MIVLLVKVHIGRVVAVGAGKHRELVAQRVIDGERVEFFRIKDLYRSDGAVLDVPDDVVAQVAVLVRPARVVGGDESVFGAGDLQYAVALLGTEASVENILVEVSGKEDVDMADRLASGDFESAYNLDVQILGCLCGAVVCDVHIVAPAVAPRVRVVVGNRQNVNTFHIRLHNPHFRAHLRIGVDGVHVQVRRVGIESVDLRKVYLARIERFSAVREVHSVRIHPPVVDIVLRTAGGIVLRESRDAVKRGCKDDGKCLFHFNVLDCLTQSYDNNLYICKIKRN